MSFKINITLLTMQNYVSQLNEIRLYEQALAQPLFDRLYLAMLAIGDEKPKGKDTYAKTFWFKRNATPSNLAEETIIELQKLVDLPSNCIGMEWWIGRLRHGKKLNFHFDRDLSLSENTGESISPLLSSVFYLNQYDSSPTVVLDQVPGVDGKSKVPPKVKMSASIMAIPNHYAVFPGNLRHGVIPDGNKLHRDDPAEFRFTFLVNYWDRRPSAPVCCDYDGSVYSALAL